MGVYMRSILLQLHIEIGSYGKRTFERNLVSLNTLNRLLRDCSLPVLQLWSNIHWFPLHWSLTLS